MDRCQYPGSDQKSAQQGQTKSDDGEKNSPDLERVALFHDERGMEQRGAGKPRHETSIFHWVPKPPATPAQLIICPIGAHCDAQSQEGPAQHGPWTYPAGPSLIDAAGNECRHSKRKANREANVACVEQRGVNGEADILQNRVEVIAFQRGREHPQEWVGGKEGKAAKPCD